MKETTPREKVLKNIRNALMHKNENPFLDAQIHADMYAPVDSVTDVAFAQSFTAAGGVFFYCEDEKAMVMQLATLARERNWKSVFTFIPELVDILNLIKLNPVSDPALPDELQAGITFCESLIARTGTIVVSSFASSGRRMVVHPEAHIVIGYASQVVQDIQHALDDLKNRYGDALPSFISLITGPSRTADIEKTLVMGAHGPRELMLFFIDDRPDREEESAHP
ncbi:MAG TPA: LUD domain-containing protein [Bacteroidales bacterium]|nr:LUD domain-containing protein [Bacteroidales bacterium]HRZ49480.1 LUD domain-containing protein [Bacteroidales bacterium]